MTTLGSRALSIHRVHWAEILFWLFALAVPIVFPKHLALGSSVLIMALFALSYDLLIGFAGILTLGQALFYGVGAYAAAHLALAGWTEAISGAALAGLFSVAIAVTTGPFILRLTHMPLVMVTIAMNAIALEAANKASWFTNGADGLSGFRVAPLFGYFHWSIFGQTKYLYVLGWVFLCFYLMRRLIASPFGMALQGIRENRTRMRLIGNRVHLHLNIAYSIGAFFAGVAGALSAQTNAFVGLEDLSLDLTLDGLVMVVLGGLGMLYGALIGAPLYMSLKHFAQQGNSFYWLFLVGALLILIVRFQRGGVIALLARAIRLQPYWKDRDEAGT